MTDLTDLPSLEIKYEQGQPFNPFEQLLGVLPPASGHFLPKPYRDLMMSPSSPLLDMYPEKFEIDMEGYSNPWEGVVKLPFFDEERLMAALAKIPKEALTEEEINRNTLSDALLVMHDRNDKAVIKATIPGALPDLDPAMSSAVCYRDPDYDAATQVFKETNDEEVTIHRSEGFPTLSSAVEFTTDTYMAGVNVFGNPSRKESTIVRVANSVHPEKNIEKIQEEWLGKPCFVNWPYLSEAIVVGMTDGKQRIFNDGNGLQRESVETFNKQIVEERQWHINRGVDCGDIEILLFVKLFEGMQFCGNGTYKKSYAAKETTCAYKIAVRPSPSALFDPRFAEKARQKLKEVYPVDANILFCGNPHFGSIGKVVSHGEDNTVDVEIQPSPKEMFHGRAIAAAEDQQYVRAHDACRTLKMSNQLLSSITSSVFVVCNPGKADLGLGLKFTGKQLQAPGFARRKSEQDGWEYSNKTIALITEYKSKFPQLFHFLEHAVNMKAYNSSDIFRDGNDKEMIAAVMKWLDDVGVTHLKLVPCSRISLSREAIQAVERGNNAFHKKNTASAQTVKLLKGVKPSLLLKPMTQICAPRASTFSLGDRVINVREDTAVPFGLRGTIVGFHDHLVEVVLDAQVLGASNLDGVCGPLRGMRMTMTSLLNLQPKTAETKKKASGAAASAMPMRSSRNTLTKEDQKHFQERKKLAEAMVPKPSKARPAKQTQVQNPHFKDKASWAGLDPEQDIRLVPGTRGTRLVKQTTAAPDAGSLPLPNFAQPKPKAGLAAQGLAQMSLNPQGAASGAPMVMPPIPLPLGMTMLPGGVMQPGLPIQVPAPAPASGPKSEVVKVLYTKVNAAPAEEEEEEAEEEDGVNAIGETLYALVEKLNAPLAGKITGMLLEMDQEDLMLLLDSPEHLEDTVGQAVDALREAGQA